MEGSGNTIKQMGEVVKRGCGGRVAVVLSGSKKKDTVERNMMLEGLINLFYLFGCSGF